MRGRRGETRGRGRRRAMILGVAGLVAIAGLAPATADAKKKKKNQVPAATATSVALLFPGLLQSATANCPPRTHITGGGWTVAPLYSANGSNAVTDDTGTRTIHLQSQPSGLLAWTSGVGTFSSPTISGSMTTFARCESNRLGTLVGGVSGSSTIPVGQSTTVDLNCPAGTHVVTAGYSGSPAGNLADSTPQSRRLLIAQSKRLDLDTWQIVAVNPIGAPSVATLATNVLCERNKKGVVVTEATSSQAIVLNGRNSATATCLGKTHVIGGGFQLSPLAGPGIGIDQMQPAGNGWQVGFHSWPGLTGGGSVAAYAYCKKNSVPRKKKH